MRFSVVRVAIALALALPAAAAAQEPAAPAQQPAAPAQQPPRPFPEGSKFAFVDIQQIAAESVEGKASTAKVQALRDKKVAELSELNKKVQADQQKLAQQGSMLNDQARAELERTIDRQSKDLQRAQQDATDEVQQLQQDLQKSFEGKLLPIIQKVVTEKGIQILFSRADSGIVLADPALDLTAEVIQRLDTATGPAAPSTPPAAPPAGGSQPQR